MKYTNSRLARFILRENRFIARCRLLETNQEVVVHVKNTGRSRELLLPDTLVCLQYVESQTRKTSYDLIAVKKNDQWINIDSQLPNQLVKEGILAKKIFLPETAKGISLLKPEVVYQHSKFDFYFETGDNKKGFIEVKGMTLENKEIGAFPDAPTSRGLKHISELILARQAGYLATLIFVVQFEKIRCATIHREMQPAFAQKIEEALLAGVNVLAYNCIVTPDMVILKSSVVFDVNCPFEEPTIE